jgi:hypothetical protein
MSAYAFERTCDLSNGYLGKQYRGKGTMGSEVLLKIQECFPDLNIHWLLTGKGRMIRHVLPYASDEEPAVEMVQVLQEQIALLQKSLNDKNELIGLLKKKRPLKRSALAI